MEVSRRLRFQSMNIVTAATVDAAVAAGVPNDAVEAAEVFLAAVVDSNRLAAATTRTQSSMLPKVANSSRVSNSFARFAN